jgi:hypothetical protein
VRHWLFVRWFAFVQMFEDELDEIDYLVGMIHFRIFQLERLNR